MRLGFDNNALADITYFIKEDRKKALKIMKLIDEIVRDPFKGTGKPEPLKYLSTGAWSRRIDDMHRLVYQVDNDSIIILTCRYHY